jgi:hypothetical protein
VAVYLAVGGVSEWECPMRAFWYTFISNETLRLPCRGSCSAFGVVHTLDVMNVCVKMYAKRIDRNGNRRCKLNFSCIHIQTMLRNICAISLLVCSKRNE